MRKTEISYSIHDNRKHISHTSWPRGIAAWPVRGGPVASVKKVATERNLANNVREFGKQRLQSDVVRNKKKEKGN